jgi:hypothetical protein
MEMEFKSLDEHKDYVTIAESLLYSRWNRAKILFTIDNFSAYKSAVEDCLPPSNV